jgi:hypothetical protein
MANGSSGTVELKQAQAFVGETYLHDFQPYGRRWVRIERIDAYRGAMMVVGTVVKGTETSYLCGFTSTKDITGQQDVAYGVHLHHLQRGEKISIAM